MQYADLVSPTGFNIGDKIATVSSTSTFDFPYNLAASVPSLPQAVAESVCVFYNVNWLHDYWYDSGFTEKAGNAQLNNYGRGGLANDRILAESFVEAHHQLLYFLVHTDCSYLKRATLVALTTPT